MVRLLLGLTACAAMAMADGKNEKNQYISPSSFPFRGDAHSALATDPVFAPFHLPTVTFNVVGLREDAGDSFGVMVNGKLTKLTTTKDTYPLWSANVAGVDAPLSYKYVQLEKSGKVGKQEKEERKLPQGAVHTPNEFFDRSHTLHNLPPLPQVYDNKLEQNSPFFREGFIGNIFVEGDPAKIKYLNKGGSDFHPDPIKVQVQYIG